MAVLKRAILAVAALAIAAGATRNARADDTLAPHPDVALSAFPKVTVEARIEDTGASGHMDVKPANENRSATVVIADMPK